MVNFVNNKIQYISHKTQSFIQNESVRIILDTNLLTEFVRQTMEEKGLTAREVERLSGKAITHSYVNKIKNGDAKNPSPSILQALAKGLGEPEEVLFALVRGKQPDVKVIENEEFALISKLYAQLPDEEKKTIEPLLNALKTTVGNSWQKASQFTFKEILNDIGKDYGITFEPSIFPDSPGPSERYENVWIYNASQISTIELIRWIGTYDSLQRTVQITYFDDFDKDKLEQDLRKAVEKLIDAGNEKVLQSSLPSYRKSSEQDPDPDDVIEIQNTALYARPKPKLNDEKSEFQNFVLPDKRQKLKKDETSEADAANDELTSPINKLIPESPKEENRKS